MAVSLVVTSCKDSNPSDAASAAVQPSKKLSKAEIDKALMDYATAGEMHRWMAKMDGIWDADIKSWVYPDSPAMYTKGVAVYKMSPDSLHQESVHRSDMGAMKFEGRSVMGYDNVKKVFVSTWYDNMSSGIMVMEGTYDPVKKVFTSRGRCVDPTAGSEVEMREVVTYTDDNNFHMEMYSTRDGRETKTMELTAKKRK